MNNTETTIPSKTGQTDIKCTCFSVLLVGWFILVGITCSTYPIASTAWRQSLIWPQLWQCCLYCCRADKRSPHHFPCRILRLEVVLLVYNAVFVHLAGQIWQQWQEKVRQVSAIHETAIHGCHLWVVHHCAAISIALGCWSVNALEYVLPHCIIVLYNVC